MVTEHAVQALASGLSALRAHAGTIAIATGIYLLFSLIIRYDQVPTSWLSRLARFPSPGLGHPLFGHARELYAGGDGTEVPAGRLLDWHERYGDVFVLRALFGAKRILLHDSAALHHTYNRPDIFAKSPIVTKQQELLTGRGLLVSEGEEHRRHRRIVAPAFAAAAMADLTPSFSAKAVVLAEQWEKLLSASDSEDKKGKEVEVSMWLARVTLDALGAGAFDVEFGTLYSKDDPTSASQGTMLEQEFSEVAREMALEQVGNRNSPLKLLYAFLVLIFIPLKTIKARKGFGSPILAGEIKATAAVQDAAHKLVAERAGNTRAQDASSRAGRNVLDLLLRSNAASEEKSRMTTDEIVNQLSTFIIAGHITTASTISWLLLLLARHQDIQSDLRSELRAAKSKARTEGLADPSGELPHSLLDELPLLDAVVREILRVRPVVPYAVRTVAEDAVIPLGNTIDLKDGTSTDLLHVKKGDTLVTNYYICNFRKDVFGEDANDFRPSRWLEDPDCGKKGNLRGASVYSQLMSFAGGPRGCIGWRFAVWEIKAVIAVIVDRFAFDPVPGLAFEAAVNLVMQARVVGAQEKTSGVPLLVSAAQ